MNKILQSTWMVAVLGMIMYLGTTALIWRMPKRMVVPKAGAHEVRAKRTLVPSWDYDNPEMDTLLVELRTKEAGIREKQGELEKWETRLLNENEELRKLRSQVEQMQTNLNSTITVVREDEVPNLKRTAKIYTSMAPEAAARILLNLEDESLVKMLVLMKESESAPIMEQMATDPLQTKRVARLTERIRLSTSRPTAAQAKAKSS
jgi:flagellar motility protein MotE (MotC chaperone)